MELLEAVRTAIPDPTPWMIGAMLVVIAVLSVESDRRPREVRVAHGRTSRRATG